MGTIFGLIIPVFGVIFLGFLTRRKSLLPESSVEALNRFAYYFALPPLLFTLTVRAPLKAFFNWAFILAFLGGAGVTLIIALVVGWAFFKRRGADLSLHALAAVFGNTAYMGVPLFVTAFGPDGALPAVVATIVSNVVLFGGAIVAVEFQNTARASAWRLGRSLLLNPLLLGCYLGLIYAARGATLPQPVAAFLNLMAQPAAPVALFALGLSLAGGGLTGSLTEVGWLVTLKLVLHPVITWAFALPLLGQDQLWMKSAVIMAAMPVGALVFVLSQFHGIQVGRASSSIVLSTLLSLASLTLFMLLLEVK